MQGKILLVVILFTVSTLVTSYLLSHVTYALASLSPCSRLSSSSTLENSLPETGSRDSGLRFYDEISMTLNVRG